MTLWFSGDRGDRGGRGCRGGRRGSDSGSGSKSCSKRTGAKGLSGPQRREDSESSGLDEDGFPSLEILRQVIPHPTPNVLRKVRVGRFVTVSSVVARACGATLVPKQARETAAAATSAVVLIQNTNVQHACVLVTSKKAVKIKPVLSFPTGMNATGTAVQLQFPLTEIFDGHSRPLRS